MDDDIRKGQMFKLATDAGKLAWNSSTTMSMGTTEEREAYRSAMESMNTDPVSRLARMVQTVMEADMRGLSTQAVVIQMREEGARLGLVDTDVDTVLGLAADAYATKAATRNPEFFDDGIHARLMQRTFGIMAAMHGHDMVGATESMHVIDYADYASAYSNQREVVERPANGKAEVGQQGEPNHSPAQPVQNVSVSLREGIRTREPTATAIVSMADMKFGMACDALSKIDRIPEGTDGKSKVGEHLLRVKDSVNDRLYGRASIESPPSAQDASNMLDKVKNAFAAGSGRVGDQFSTVFKEVLHSITTEVGSYMARQSKLESSRNQDLNA